jgi:hypothetical protein
VHHVFFAGIVVLSRFLPPVLKSGQKVDRLRDLYELEAVLELSRAMPDINYLLQLDLESSFLRDVVASIGEQI